ENRLGRLRIEAMKVDVVIALRIERPIDANHACPRSEVLLLSIILKHDERDVATESEIDPVIRRFDGIDPTDRPCSSCERVDIAVGNAESLSDEAGSAPFFIVRTKLSLSETGLIGEDRNGKDGQGQRCHGQNRSYPRPTQVDGGKPD